MLKKLTTTVSIIAVLLAAAGSLYFLLQSAQTKPASARTEPPQFVDIVRKVVAIGSIVPRQEVTIKPRVSGVIESLNVEVGDQVDEGSLVAKIKVLPDAVTLNAAEERVAEAEINFADSDAEMRRQDKLFASSLISKNEHSKYTLKFKLTRQELVSAKNNLNLIEEGASSEDGVVSNIIRSTVSGTILEIPVELGESVIETNNFSEGTTIATVADMSDLVFLGRVDEIDVGKLSEGMELRLQIGALENKILSGTLEFISPKGAKMDGTVQFEVRAAITHQETTVIRSGYSASADIVLERRESVLAVSERLLQFDDQGTFVEIFIGDNSFKKTYLELGISDGINTEVLSGVDADSLIKMPR